MFGDVLHQRVNWEKSRFERLSPLPESPISHHRSGQSSWPEIRKGHIHEEQSISRWRKHASLDNKVRECSDERLSSTFRREWSPRQTVCIDGWATCFTTERLPELQQSIHGSVAGKWGYLARACGDIDNQFSVLEGVIRWELIPAMTGRKVSDVERDLLGLPACLGGLGLPNPSAPFSFSSASKVTQPLVNHLLLPDGKELSTALAAQTEAVVESRKHHQEWAIHLGKFSRMRNH